MSVYDDNGNMTDERAGELAREMGQKVGDLLNYLFDRGMTFVEARALSNHLKAGINYVTAINILQHQMRRNVDVEVHGQYPACLDTECEHREKCANHISAFEAKIGDYRTEDGDTPRLAKTPTGWKCNREPADEGLGAVLTDGTYTNSPCTLSH